MKIAKASYKIEAIMPEDVMAHLERCGRTCYRSRWAPVVLHRGEDFVPEHDFSRRCDAKRWCERKLAEVALAESGGSS